MIVRYTTKVPSWWQRGGSAVATAAVALFGAVLGGVPAAAFVILTGDRSTMEWTSGGTDFVNTASGVADSPILWLLADVGVVAVAVLLATRVGHGAAGDAVFGIRAVDATGSPVATWRIVANALLPILLWTVARAQIGSGAAVLVVFALWLPALLSSDRRSIYSLLTGTHYLVDVPVKGVKRGWASLAPQDRDDHEGWERTDPTS